MQKNFSYQVQLTIFLFGNTTQKPQIRQLMFSDFIDNLLEKKFLVLDAIGD